MRFALVVLVCLIFAITVAAQSPGEDRAASSETTITLAREERDGSISEGRESFNPDDIPVYCYVDLPSDVPTSVKFVVVVVRAVGLRANSNFVTVNFKTEKGQNQVSFTASPKKRWALGKYRVDIYLNGKKASSKPFEIVKK